jgi:hypothetical protein
MKIDRDSIIVPILLALLLFLGIGALWGHQAEHSFPYGLGASDAFQHQVRAEAIKEMGGYAHEADYMVNGFKDVVAFYPPLFYHLSALLSNMTGLETYDTTYLIVFLCGALAAAAMYFVVKHFNSYAAILSIPLFIFLFSGQFTAVFTWGQWPSAAAHVFLIAAVWALLAKGRYWWIVSGILTAAAGLVHTSEMVFLLGFLAIYGVAKIIRKDWTEVKGLLLLGATAFVVASYYLFIFQGTWARVQKYTLFKVELATGSFPTLHISDFGWVAIVICIGAIVALFAARKPAIFFAAYMYIAGLTNYIGMSFRAFQQRFFWPVYLAPFLGLALFAPLSLVPKKWRLLAAGAAAIIISVSIIMTNTMLSESQGMMDQERWDGMKWIADNTPKDSTVYFFYGDLYQQTSMLYNTKRLSTIVGVSDYAKGLMANTLRANYESMLASDSGCGFPYKKSAFSFGFHADNMTWESNASICGKDYWIFDKLTSYEQMAPLVQYNMAMRERLLLHGEEVYSNAVVSIVKNNAKGGECLEI